METSDACAQTYTFTNMLTNTHTCPPIVIHTHIHTPSGHAYSFQYLFFPKLFDYREHNIEEWGLTDVMDSSEANWKRLLHINSKNGFTYNQP